MCEEKVLNITVSDYDKIAILPVNNCNHCPYATWICYSHKGCCEQTLKDIYSFAPLPDWCPLPSVNDFDITGNKKNNWYKWISESGEE